MQFSADTDIYMMKFWYQIISNNMTQQIISFNLKDQNMEFNAIQWWLRDEQINVPQKMWDV